MIFLFCLWFAGCTQAPKGVLIQLDGARDVESTTLRGMDTLQYKLNVRYPAKEQIQQVKDHLAKLGWKPVPYIYLFPENPSSHVTGWTFFNDPPRNPESVVYEWTGDWLDQDENLLTYTFRYRDPVAKYQQKTFIVGPSQREMSVTAIYTPAGLAKHKQAMMNRKK